MSEHSVLSGAMADVPTLLALTVVLDSFPLILPLKGYYICIQFTFRLAEMLKTDHILFEKLMLSLSFSPASVWNLIVLAPTKL